MATKTELEVMVGTLESEITDLIEAADSLKVEINNLTRANSTLNAAVRSVPGSMLDPLHPQAPGGAIES